MMKISKIKIEGGAKIVPLSIPKVDEGKVAGRNMFPGVIGLYANIYLCARKRSGKTTTLANILVNCARKSTKVIIFCSTFHKDNTWIEIAKNLDLIGIKYAAYNSLTDRKSGVNRLSAMLQYLEEVAEMESKKPKHENQTYENTSAPCLMQFDDCKVLMNGEVVYKVQAPLQGTDGDEIAPEYVFVFDDLSNELNDPAVGYLMKRNRHFKSKVIVSSQYIHDLAPDARQQIDYCLLFGGIPEDKLKIIYKNLDVNIEYPIFKVFYEDATKVPYNFFKISVRTDEYSENFENAYVIEN